MSQPSQHDTTETIAPQPNAEGSSTVGTGTALALGCIAATILLVIIGLILLVVVGVFR